MCHGDLVFRMLGLLGGLSVATDLGTGSPLEDSLRRCVVATRLARVAGCTDEVVAAVVYASLLEHLGCTAFAHEAAQVWGDDIASTHLALVTDFETPVDLWRTWVPGLAEATGRSKASVLGTTLVSARGFGKHAPVATCEVARDASRRLGLPESVQESLFHVVAMWNGKGYPDSRGEDIPLVTRIVHVASTVVLFLGRLGAEGATTEVRRRAGTYLDPDLAELFADQAQELLTDLEQIDPYEQVLDAEPDPVRYVGDDEVEEVARTFGDLVDLKSPWLRGHSAGVAQVAAAAVGVLGLAREVRTVRLAGYLHDLGRVAVSSRVWDKAGPLNQSERDQVRLHAYHGERILARVPALEEVSRLVGQHHERCDGSGYHRGVGGAQLTMAARVLAAADVYHSLTEERPYRPALTPRDAAERLLAEARSGRLDADAVTAVLASDGGRVGIRHVRPAHLTERQVEVLRLMATGASNRDIGRHLGISGRTAERHVQDIYAKIGASTRAAAALFAMEHGLLDRSG